MAEMEDKLKDLLSSPEGIGNLLSLVRGLTGGDTSSAAAGESAPAGASSSAQTAALAEPANVPGSPTDAAAVSAFSAQGTPAPAAAPASSFRTPSASLFPDLSVLSKFDPKILSAAMNILGQYALDDEKILLLNALRPHLRAERRERIDKAAQIVRITKSIRAALNGFSGGIQNV